MSRRLGVAALALLLLALLALAITGGLRDALVVPLLYLLWLAGVLLGSIPQAIVWGAFVALAAVAAWRSLATPPRRRPVPPTQPGTARAAVAEWASLAAAAEREHYARWLLAARLAQLAVALLAADEPAPWQYLESERVAMPAPVREYLRAGRRSYQQPPRRLWPLAPRPATPPDPLDLHPAVALAFFEQSLHTTIGASYEPGRE